MALTFDESFEYRHKKFDQAKRLRTESSSSNSDDYDCIRGEIERLNQRPETQQTSENYSNNGSSHNEEYTIPTPSPFKRIRTAKLAEINDETLRNICAKKDKTPKDQEKRNKNAIAGRLSRREKKQEGVATEE